MIKRLLAFLTKENILQFIKFCLVGASNTLINLAAYYVLLALGAHYLVANAFGFIVSVLNAYYWNRRYVFKRAEAGVGGFDSAFLRMAASYGFTFLLSNLLLYLMINKLGISAYFAPFLNLLITIPLNFMLNKLWAFKPAAQGEVDDQQQ